MSFYQPANKVSYIHVSFVAIKYASREMLRGNQSSKRHDLDDENPRPVVFGDPLGDDDLEGENESVRAGASHAPRAYGKASNNRRGNEVRK